MNIQIQVVPSNDATGHSSQERGALFETFVKTVLLRHSTDVEKLTWTPKDADVWGYELVSQTPIVVECKASASPTPKEHVASFFGDYKLRQAQDSRTVGILISTSGFTSATADSALAYYNRIREHEPSFFLYGPEDIAAILASQGRILDPKTLFELIERVTQREPITFALIISADVTAVFVHLADGGLLVFEETGRLIDPTNYPSIASTVAPALNLSMDSIHNASYANTALSDSGASASLRPQKEEERLDIQGLINHCKLAAQLSNLSRSFQTKSVSSLPPEQQSLTVEALTLTFLEAIAPTLDGLSDEATATLVFATRIASTVISIRLIATDAHKSVSLSESALSRHAAKSLRKRTRALASKAQTIVDYVDRYAGNVDSTDSDQPDVQADAAIAALCIHAALALGPLCRSYRTVLYANEPPINAPNDTVQTENPWIDTARQALVCTSNIPSPRTFREARQNVPVLNEALQRVEDDLDRTGTRLPFTRFRASLSCPGTEIIDCYFQLETDKVLQILMGEELYGSEEVWMRELLQNSIDATKLRATLDDNAPDAFITIQHDSSRGTVSISDNGTGMTLHQIRKFFSRIGRSYYRSDELKTLLDKSNKAFEPIGKFGLGFLSVFMVARSVTIRTKSCLEPAETAGLQVYIPAPMEDFYVGRVDEQSVGTEIELTLSAPLTKSLLELASKYLLYVGIDTLIVEDGDKTLLPGDREFRNRAIDESKIGQGVELLTVVTSSEVGRSVFSLPIPSPAAASDKRGRQHDWDKLPTSRIAFGQAGIFIMDDNEFLGERRHWGDTYFPYFSRCYGLIDFAPDSMRLRVSRNEVVIEDSVRKQLQARILKELLDGLEARLSEIATSSTPAKHMNSLVRRLAFDVVEDGERYYHGRDTASTYRYSNDGAITAAMARIYSEYMLIEYVQRTQRKKSTLKALVEEQGSGERRLYYAQREAITHDELFKAWLSDQTPETVVIVVDSVREASLILAGLRSLEARLPSFREVTRQTLKDAIRYEVVQSPLDAHLRAAVGIVRYLGYQPDNPLAVVPSTLAGVVPKADGITRKRANTTEKPFVLVNVDSWLAKCLMSLAAIDLDDDALEEALGEACYQILQIGTGTSKRLRHNAARALADQLEALRDRLQDLNTRIPESLKNAPREIRLEDLISSA